VGGRGAPRELPTVIPTLASWYILRLNRYRLTLSPDEMYDLVIGVCEGTVTKKALAAAFRDDSAAFEE